MLHNDPGPPFTRRPCRLPRPSGLASGPDRLKARKDLAQADFLIRVLAEDRPGDLADAYGDALDRGPKWRDHIAASLKRLPQVAALIAGL